MTIKANASPIETAEDAHLRMMRIAEIGSHLDAFEMSGQEVAALGRELLALSGICPQCLGSGACNTCNSTGKALVPTKAFCS